MHYTLPKQMPSILLLAAVSLLLTLTYCTPTVQYDLILRNGTIIDGSGQAAYNGDLAINGENIATVGNIGKATGQIEIDVSGLVIAPGFINIHSHAQADALPTAVNMLSQGVTTEIMNADGRSPMDLNQQFQKLDSAGLALNVGGMIGFNSVWHEIVGSEDARPNETQIQQMQGLVRQGLEAGA